MTDLKNKKDKKALEEKLESNKLNKKENVNTADSAKHSEKSIKIKGQLKNVYEKEEKEINVNQSDRALAGSADVNKEKLKLIKKSVLNEELSEILERKKAQDEEYGLVNDPRDDVLNSSAIETTNTTIHRKPHQNNETRKTLKKISEARSASEYSSYSITTTKFITLLYYACSEELSRGLALVNAIFPPIVWALNTLGSVFSLLIRGVQYNTIQHTEAIDDVESLKKKLAVDFLKKSIAARTLVVILNTLTLLAFAGVMTTPIGFAFIAVNTLVTWYDEKIGAWNKAKHDLEQYTKKNPQNTASQEYFQLDTKLAQAKKEAYWGAANVVAMTLIALGPIPFVGQALALAGLGLFGLVSIRMAYVTAKPYLSPSKKESSPFNEREHTLSINTSAQTIKATLNNTFQKNSPDSNSSIKAPTDKTEQTSSHTTIFQRIRRHSHSFSGKSTKPHTSSSDISPKKNHGGRRNSS